MNYGNVSGLSFNKKLVCSVDLGHGKLIKEH